MAGLANPALDRLLQLNLGETWFELRRDPLKDLLGE